MNPINFLRFFLSTLFFSIISFHDFGLQAQEETNQIIFPRPFAIAIDDIGWNNGSDIGDHGGQGPYRDGVNTHINIKDYQAIVKVGQQVGVRFQGLFVLCEMDRKNICAHYPTTTMYGKDWDNSQNVCDEQLQIMSYVKESAAFLEFGIHGVGHEFWPNKMQKVRAEWYDLQDHKPWPENILRDHLKCFKEIMAQYDLTPENGQSFPESFVPCAYGYYWNPNGDYSLGKLLHENGVKYANTLFTCVAELNPPKEPNGGDFDHGVLVINRINYGNPWWQLGALPDIELEHQQSDIIESHFPNWFAQDTFLQEDLTKKWVLYFKSVQQHSDRYLAKNSEQFYSQWLYKKYALIKVNGSDEVTIDNTLMADEAYKYNLLGNLVLKIKIDSTQHISFATIDNKPVSCYFEDGGFAFLYLPPLENKSYLLKYRVGKQYMSDYIFNDGTYNVYNFNSNDKSVTFEIKMYGTQVVKLKSKNPKSILSSNPHLKIVSSKFDEMSGILSIEISGQDIQGERGVISMSF